MSDFLFMLSAYYMHIFAGITIVVGIILFIIRNTEEFPYSDACFDCNNKSCRRCSRPNPQKRLTHEKKLRPVVRHPVGCLQYIEAIDPEDTQILTSR